MRFKNRKIAKMRVSLSILTELLRLGADLIEAETNAPEDLEVLNVEQPVEGTYNGWFYVYMTSETYESVPPGQVIPEIEPYQYQKVYE